MKEIELAEMGYGDGDGRTNVINEYGQIGTIFSVFKIKDGVRTEEKVGKMTTFLEMWKN